ncbi:hypothetical protein TSUD_389350 [Trifolium subterraneum]|uniref:Reverse transcriptase domain-containing protein n=1 Tax=Trifolium subterraneum TaxID=3900 RepID=A0A2Z6NG15_TRISU|nr:hypothetical protein TSUD_389350 [Trifolium subterraneum]
MNHFSESVNNQPTLDGIEFQGFDPGEVLTLTVPFTPTKIEEVVLSSDGDKSPGPDGFNFAFFKMFWGLLKDDVRVLFDKFFVKADLPRSFSSYFITLIPKVHSSFNIRDFNPISLVGSLYKIIAKVLAKRLTKVMDKLISPNQSAFIKGRQFVDGVLAVNEIIDLAKKSRKECLIFKVDFEKAYDSVSWNFLDYMMIRFGFGDQWCGWIKTCVFSGNLFVLVNDSPTEEINIQRGLKQGDPLASFLFLLVVEGLSGAIESAEELDMALYLHPLILEGGLGGLRRASCWWRNVSLLGDPEDAISDWFSEGVTKKVGNGHLTSFWFDPWLGGVPLRTRFQKLFQVSDQSVSTVGEMGSWVESQWVRDLRWRRDLFVWELNILESFYEILNHSTISAADDSWFWKHDLTGQYSVKSAFLALSRATTDDVIFSVEEERLLPKVWKTLAPSKVASFLGNFCKIGSESADHLFSFCNQISPVWYGMLRWLGVEMVPPRGVLGFLRFSWA